MLKVFRNAAVPLVALALVAAACANDETTTAGTSPTAAECNQDIKVGLALDVGGLGDKSFNDAAYAGLQQAIGEGLVCDDNTEFLEANATGSNRGENITNLAEAGYDLIIGVGFAFSPDINQIAPDYPDQSFAIIDGYGTCGTACGLANDADAIPNVADLTFTEEQGSFLVGAAAALEAQSMGCDTVGFLGGQTGTLIGKFQAGYEAGVAQVDPNIEVLVEYIGDDVTAFNDATKGETLSTSMYDDGACIIYHAAGASGAGLFNAAVKADALAIGVDSDQYLTASAEQAPLIMTSMLKRVDTAVHDAISQVGDGTFEGGAATVFDLAAEGLDYSKSNTELMTQDIIDQLEQYRQDIIDGTITVPSEPSS
jgi:basic membrane protein A